MKSIMDDIIFGANNIRKEAKRLHDLVEAIDSDDIAVKGYAKRLKMAIFQSLDNCHDIERQGRFVANAERIASLRKRVEDVRNAARKRKKTVQTEEIYGTE